MFQPLPAAACQRWYVTRARANTRWQRREQLDQAMRQRVTTAAGTALSPGGGGCGGCGEGCDSWVCGGGEGDGDGDGEGDGEGDGSGDGCA